MRITLASITSAKRLHKICQINKLIENYQKNESCVVLEGWYCFLLKYLETCSCCGRIISDRKCANNVKLLSEERKRFTLFAKKTKDTSKDKVVQRMFTEFKFIIIQI